MENKTLDAKRICLERLMQAGSKDQLAKALAIENCQVYTRYDIVHKAR